MQRALGDEIEHATHGLAPPDAQLGRREIGLCVRVCERMRDTRRGEERWEKEAGIDTSRVAGTGMEVRVEMQLAGDEYTTKRRKSLTVPRPDHRDDIF